MISSNIKVFKKWLIGSAIFVLSIILITLLFNEYKGGNIIIFISQMIGVAIMFAFLMTLVEVKIIPWQKERTRKKIREIFSPKEITPNIFSYMIGEIIVFIELGHALAISSHKYSGEIVSFYALKEEIENSSCNPKFKKLEVEFLTQPCYRIYETNKSGLTRAKRLIKEGFKA